MIKPVILCIGTNKIIGDSLGPLVGDFLSDIYDVNAYVYGKSDKNVNGINFKNYTKHLDCHHKNALIIAVDSCVGNKEDVGKVKYTKAGVKAGGALGKDNLRIGDIGILGVVAEKCNDNFNQLKKVDKIFIEDMAFYISGKIVTLLKHFDKSSAFFLDTARHSNLIYAM